MLTFYCFPSWRTCQKAKAWLSEKNVEYEYRNILKEPPLLEELEKLAEQKGILVNDLLNPRSKALKDKDIDLEKTTALEASQYIMENPRVMYRPLLTNGESLVIGFKPEEIENLL